MKYLALLIAFLGVVEGLVMLHRGETQGVALWFIFSTLWVIVTAIWESRAK